MPPQPPPRVKMITTGTGTGALKMSGVVPRMHGFAAAGYKDGDRLYVVIEHQSAVEWEIALVEIRGDTLIRRETFSSSTGGRAIDFSPGLKIVSDISTEVSQSVITGMEELVTDLVESVSALEGKVDDLGSPADDAYAAQQALMQAQAAELSARLSQARNFPPDFVEDSKWWTGGNGQAGSPEAAADNPLPGTFVDVAGDGRVYQTEANPQSSGGFGPIGVIAGVPGTAIRLRTRIRAVTENTRGGPATIGLTLVCLDAPINYGRFARGGGLTGVTVAQGWREIDYSFVVPPTDDGDYMPYYRPSLFYNVVGESSDPLQGSNRPQGNQQFQVAWFSIVVTPGPVASVPKLIKYRTGSGSYAPSAGVKWIEVEMKGGGGGGAGSGTGSPGNGAAGGNTTFKGWIANGGGGGGASNDGWGAGGAGGTVTIGGGDNGHDSRDGQNGFNCPDGPPYTYASGAAGGGGTPSIAGKYFSTPALPADSGLGGPGGGTDAGAKGGGGGGEGGYVRFILASADLGSSAIAYAVGAGGSGGAAGDGAAGGSGAAGYIRITEHFS